MGASYNSELGHDEQYLKDCAKALIDNCDLRGNKCDDCCFYSVEMNECNIDGLPYDWEVE